MSSPQTIKTIPWLWLTGVFLIYALIGRFTASVWPAALALAWTCECYLLAIDYFDSESLDFFNRR